jgi:Ca-activated chloride channel family protein
VAFAKNNAAKITAALAKITPQGMSPIAYSIELGAKDFPADTQSLNSIILITDGEETCDGDPCKISKELAAHRVSLKPFIVGLNVDSVSKDKYKCMGAFFDTKDKSSFYNAVGVIIKQTLNTTTAQINLLDANGDPTVTNIPFTLYDHYTGVIEYNFVHTLNEKGNPDTLYLDPVGVYDLELHTYPPIRKENIELTPGKHNIIALDASYGNLTVGCIASSIASNSAQVLVRPKADAKNILNVQDLNGQGSYLAGNYKLEILTTPETIRDTGIAAFTDNKLTIDNYGTLSMIAADNFLASVYTYNKGTLRMVEHFDINGKTESRKYQPGDYRLVYKPKNNYHSESTKSLQFTIEEDKTTVLTL